MPDVIISGAGPAGISAALELVRGGRSVVVIEKAKFPRDKCCGDGLTTLALRQYEALGFDPRQLNTWAEVRSTVFCAPNGHQTRLQAPDNDGIRIGVAKREELDAAFVAFARTKGVEVREGLTITDITRSEHGVQATLSDGTTISGAYAIGADGMWSPLRHLINNPSPADHGNDNHPDAKSPRYLGDIHAFRQYFEVTGKAREELWVWFEPDLLPGYVWSFPLGDGTANVGFGIERKPNESVSWMKDAWTDILTRPHIAEVLGNIKPIGNHKAWPIPARIRSDLLSSFGGRVLYVGDAARVVDPLTGEGIGQAMETGHMAAVAIARGGVANPRRTEQLYKRAIQSGIKIDNTFARSIAKLVTSQRMATTAIKLAPKGPWKGRYAFKWAFEDNPRAALLTPWRYPKRFRNKRGAFLDTPNNPGNQNVRSNAKV